MPFNPTTQTAKNAGLVLQCEECLKWRMVHSKHKLKPAVKAKVTSEIESLMYTCGSVFQDIDGHESSCLKDVYVRQNLTCRDDIEVTYYGAGNENICIHCGVLDSLILEDGYYAICQSCRVLNKMISRRTRVVYKPKD
jgi:hypothetical protein